MQSPCHMFLVFVCTIFITVQNIASVPSGKITHMINRGADINGTIYGGARRIDCVASLQHSGCKGVLLARGWLLTLSKCTVNSSDIEVRFICKGRAPFTVGVIDRVSRGRFSLLYLKRETAVSSMFYFELPQNPDDKQYRKDAFVSVLPKQTRDIVAEPVFIENCPLKDQRIVSEEICLLSKTQRTLKICELATGLPVATLEGNNAKTVVALLENAGCNENGHRQRRTINENPVVGIRITEPDAKWIRKIRSIDGECLFLNFYLMKCSYISVVDASSLVLNVLLGRVPMCFHPPPLMTISSYVCPGCIYCFAK